MIVTLSFIITAVVADVLLLVGELDVFVEHGPEREPHLAVLAHKDFLRLAQVVVVKVHTQAAKRLIVQAVLSMSLYSPIEEGLTRNSGRR